MASGETVGTEQFGAVNLIDVGRWLLAAVVVGAMAAGGLSLLQDWAPPAGQTLIAEPVILLDLAPIVPETAAPEPVAEPLSETAEPEVERTPSPPSVEPEPAQAATEPPPPEEPRVEPELAPEPEPVVEPLPAPASGPDAPTVTMPMPAIMSGALRQQREATPATSPQASRATTRPTPQPPDQQAETPRPVPQPSPPAAASGPSPGEWQQQVLRHIDRRKVYPRDAQRAGQEGVVSIAFTIDASGGVVSASVARSSGFPALDQAALETARRASPVPRPPATLGSSVALTASIRFAIR